MTAMVSAPPTPKAVRDLLGELLGRTPRVAPGVPYAPGYGEPATQAVYVDQRMRTKAVVSADLRGSAYLAAMVARLPAGALEEVWKQRLLTPALTGHLDRVLDGLSPLFGGQVRRYASYPPASDPPTDVAAFARALGNRLDLAVGFAQYGIGRLSLVTTAVS
jgi:hypothetical protein